MPENYNENLIILHLSDLHFGYFNRFSHKPYSLKYHWRKVIEKLNEIFNGNEADLMVITGDLTSFGIQDDFDEAVEFIETNFDNFIKNKRLFLVPGNHDLIWSSDRKQIPNPNRFTEYYKNLNKLMGINKSNNYYNDPHFYRPIKIKKNSNNLSTIILGVNSCLYTAYEDKLPNANFNEDLRKRASINEEDLLKYLEKIAENKEYSNEKYPIRILLLHHDLSSIKKFDVNCLDHDQLLTRLGDRNYQFEIIIHGHKHKKVLRSEEDKVIIGGGSLFVKDSELLSNSKFKSFLKKNYNDILNKSFDKINIEDLPVKRPNQLNIIEISYAFYNPSFKPVIKVSLESIRTDFWSDPGYVKDDFKYIGMSKKQFKELEKSLQHEKKVDKTPEEIFNEIPEIFYVIDKTHLYDKSNIKNEFLDYYTKLLEKSFQKPDVFQKIFDSTFKKFRRDWIRRKYTKAKHDLIIKLSLMPKENIQSIEIKFNFNFFIHKLPEFIYNTEFSEVKEKLEIINEFGRKSVYDIAMSALREIISPKEKLSIEDEKFDMSLSTVSSMIKELWTEINEKDNELQNYKDFLKKKGFGLDFKKFSH